MHTPIDTALDHMHAALRLLDEAGASASALRLQQAIDIAEGTPPMKPGDTLAALIDRLFNAAWQADAGRNETDRPSRP